MTLYDSSLLIEYLDGDEHAVAFVEERVDAAAVTVPLAMFELYQGEVFKTGPTDLDGLSAALAWLDVVDATSGFARAAAELQGDLRAAGAPLGARDAYIAGAAAAIGEPLAATDDDFRNEALSNHLDVTVV